MDQSLADSASAAGLPGCRDVSGLDPESGTDQTLCHSASSTGLPGCGDASGWDVMPGSETDQSLSHRASSTELPGCGDASGWDVMPSGTDQSLCHSASSTGLPGCGDASGWECNLMSESSGLGEQQFQGVHQSACFDEQEWLQFRESVGLEAPVAQDFVGSSDFCDARNLEMH